MIDKTNGIVQELPLRKTEEIRVRDVKVGDYIISENSAGVGFYRLVVEVSHDRRGQVSLDYDPDRWICADEDPHKRGFCNIIPGASNGGNSYCFLSTTMVRRVTDLDDVHVSYLTRKREFDHMKQDRLVDGRFIWDIGSHVHGKSRQMLVRFNTEDNYVEVPMGSIALLTSKR